MRFPQAAIAFLALPVLAALVILATLVVLRQNTEAAATYGSGPIAGDTTWALAASPTPTPTPGFPSTVKTFVNDTGQVVNDLHVEIDLAAYVDLLVNAPGCPTPSISGGILFSAFDVVWAATCVDPGESVTVEIFSDCPAPLCSPPTILSHYWTLDGTPLGTSTPTPTPVGIGGVVELRTDTDAPTDRPASGDSFPIGAAVVLGVLVLGAGGMYAVKLRRG